MAAGLTDAALVSGKGAVRIMLFVGGPTTEGFGQVVGKELQEPIRSHKVLRARLHKPSASAPGRPCAGLLHATRPGAECRIPSTCDIARCIANRTVAVLQEVSDHLGVIISE